MAVKFFCAGCNNEIHLSAEETKFRVDLATAGNKVGFDVCESCYTKVEVALGVSVRSLGA